MFANVKTRKIEVSKRESEAIGRPTTQEFQEFVALKSVFPTFTMKVVAKRGGSNVIKYAVMIKYMQDLIQKSEGEQKAEYEKKYNDFKFMTTKQEGLNTAKSFDVTEWFLKEFPEYSEAKKDHQKKIDEILGRKVA